jgi:Lipopolysaccharide-assembly
MYFRPQHQPPGFQSKTRMRTECRDTRLASGRSGPPGFFVTVVSLAVFAALAVSSPGCANYRLGTGVSSAFRTLYIEPVANQTLLPQSQALLSTHLRESFARDGRITLVNTSEAADATLSVLINDYHRDVAAGRADDTGLARKFDVTLGASCTLRDRRTGHAIFSGRPVQVRREVFTDSGQLQAEFQTLPLLTDALARKVVSAALDVW